MNGPTTQFPPGTVLMGKYRIEHLLGAGGMGVVAMATHLQLNERVALKFLLPEVMNNTEVVQRFLREAQAAVKLKGEHVARVIDVGTLDGGVPYMVMEYLEGGDMSQLLDQSGPLPPPIAVDYALQACAALAEAHALGIVHRDIKPANFFITRRPDGSPLLKVLDFGISKAPVTVEQNLTRTQSVMGTPAYMSPEQMRSTRDVDPRSDIWSLGVVIYELLAGQRPFRSESFSELCLKVAMDPLPPLVLPHAPHLGQVVERCLAKDPGHRFQNVAELAAALAPFAQNPHHAQMIVERAARTLGLTAPLSAHVPSHSGAMAGPATPTSIGAGSGQVLTPRRAGLSRRAGVIGGAVVAVAVAAVLIVVLGTGSNKTSTSSDEPERPAASAPIESETPAATPPANADPPNATGATPKTEVTTTTTPDAGAGAGATEPANEPAAQTAKTIAKEHEPKKRSRRSKRRKRKKRRASGSDEDDILGTRN